MKRNSESRTASVWRSVAAAEVLGLAALGLAGLITIAGPAQADPVVLGPASMEGVLKILPGDNIAAGYRFAIPGTHPANTITFANAMVTIPVSCTSGGPSAGTITINLAPASYPIAANDTGWHPASNEADPASYQGSTVAPNLCGGGYMYSAANSPAPKGGATFSADVFAAVPTSLSLSFHYRDPNAKGKGNINCADPSSNPYPADKGPCGASWSATTSFSLKNPPPTTTTTSSSTTTTSTSTSTSTTTTTIKPFTNTTPEVSVGYADDLHEGTPAEIAFHPTPWEGDPGVVFLGCHDGAPGCDKFDAGAIRIDNPIDNGPLTLTGASVDISNNVNADVCHFQIWDKLLPAVAQPGESFVLTQTGSLLGPPQAPPCDGRVEPGKRPITNFDTSEGPLDTISPPFSNCDPLLVNAPVIHLTFTNSFGSFTLTVTDAAKILNTGGVDRYACSYPLDEATEWTIVPPANVVRTPPL